MTLPILPEIVEYKTPSFPFTVCKISDPTLMLETYVKVPLAISPLSRLNSTIDKLPATSPRTIEFCKNYTSTIVFTLWYRQRLTSLPNL